MRDWGMTSRLSVSLEAPDVGLRCVCRDLLPNWRDVDQTRIQFDAISGGITNTLYKAEAPGRDPVLIRVYGLFTENLINRETEVRRMEVLSRNGFGPKVLGMFGNGRIESFLVSRPLEPEEMGHPAAIPKIAARLADLHNISLNEPRQPQLFNTLWDWVKKAEGVHFSDGRKQQYFRENISLSQIKDDLPHLEAAVEALQSPVVFCHKDLLAGNILLLGERPSLKDSLITVIDYEYSNYSYRGFDFGNHFNEYAGFDGNFDHKYPSLETQRHFFSCYLSHSAGRENVADRPSVESLLHEASVFSVLSHLYWGIWSLVQARYSTIDFDFLTYAGVRISHYLKRRSCLSAASLC